MTQLSSSHFYTRRQAEQLIGLVYELVYPYFGVPDGTRGKIVDIHSIARVLGNGYELVIEWDLAGIPQDGLHRDQPIPPKSWFSRAEMERYMQRAEKGRLPPPPGGEGERRKRGRKPQSRS